MSQCSKLYQFWTRALYVLAVAAILQPSAIGYPNEACGIVSNIVDGDTIDVTVERGDPRTSSGIERIRLADVDSPEIDTQDGARARDLASAILLNRRVYLDIDDYSVRDSYGRLVCVVYLSGYYDQPISLPCFNRIMVDSGEADVYDFDDNEFDPDDWWRGSRKSYVSASGLQKVSQTDAETSYGEPTSSDPTYGDLTSSSLTYSDSNPSDPNYRDTTVSGPASSETSDGQTSSSGIKTGKSDLEKILGDIMHLLYSELLKELNKRAI